jgi:hypothetical protein
MGPDPSWTVPAVTAIGQLLLGIDELVNEVFQLGLDERLVDAAAAFQASLSWMTAAAIRSADCVCAAKEVVARYSWR